MTNRYTSFESTADAYDADTLTFTGAKHDIDVITEELTPERNNIYPVTSKGRTPRRKLKGPLAWTGNIETLLYTISAPSLVYYAMGANTTTLDTPALGVNTHTVTPAATIPHFVMETGRDLDASQYTGVVATGFSLEYSPDAAVTINVDVNARKEQAKTTLDTITFPDFDGAERTYGGVEVVTQIGAAEGGTPTTFGTVESFSLTYDNNFEDSAYVLGSQYLSGNFVNQINCTGSMELSYLVVTDYDDVVADVEKELWLVCNNGDTTPVTDERGYTVKMPRISYDTTGLPTNNAERFVQSLEFTCNDNAAGNALEVDFINEQTEAAFIA
jgi:hypothetical protein